MGDLSIQNLVVEYYSGGYALRPINGLSLDVSAGSLVILLGPSGCGKTTLLSCLGGILRPKSGAIKFDDVDITTLHGTGLANYRRDKVGIVFQAFNLVPSLSALENVMVPMREAGMSRKAARKRAEELLDPRQPGRADEAPAGRPERGAATARRGRPRDRTGSAADSRRRADRTPGFHPGGGGAAADPRTGGRGSRGGGRHPRQPGCCRWPTASSS